MNRRIPRLMPARKHGPIAMLGVVVAASLAIAAARYPWDRSSDP
jgi:hypothetical protein